MKFVILTDTHLVPDGRLYALDPAERLGAAIQAINRCHDDLTFVIVTGDLAHWGELGAYRFSESGWRPCAFGPFRREPFRAVFQDADDDGNGFVQSVRRLDHATIITLDTLGESRDGHAGRLCEKRLAFLGAALADAPRDTPLLLFQHHPPLDLGLPHMDAIRLRDSEQEWETFRRARKPDFMFFGHVHRPVAGLW
jgi:3',5'-cyclic-AMP phosphodiesterase